MSRRRYAPAPVRTSVCDPAHLIKNSPQVELLRHREGGTEDIIEAIMYMDAHSHEWITERVDCLRGSTDYDTLRNVWSFVRNTLRYRADRPGHERVKSPGALFTSGVGDCKSMSIAVGAILRSLGYAYRYRFTAYEPGDYSHVYVVATDAQGHDVILDTVHTAFDEEVQYRRKKDLKPQATHIGNTPPPTVSGHRFPILRVGLALWVAYLLIK